MTLNISNKIKFDDAYFLECETGRFGMDCASRCGRCTGNRPCHHETGQCSSGCRDGWVGSKCNRSKKHSTNWCYI